MTHFNRDGLVNEHRTEPITQFYKVDKAKLGEGSFGSVCKATHKDTQKVIAVKNIAKKNLKDAQKFKEEVQLMKELDHPNIVRIFETFEDSRCLYLIMELCEGGELFDKIIDLGYFSEHDAATCLSQILSAIFYLHKHMITHRDLKPENFLLETKAKDSPLKVIDFGLSCKFTAGKPLTTKAGTPYYVAPQVLQGSYDHKADVWSCGVLLYVLLCGYPPFYGDNDGQILAMVKKGEFDFPPEEWDEVSNDAKELVGKLLAFDPAKRPECEEALAHGWFAKNKDPANKESLKGNFMGKLKTFHKSGKLKKVALTAIARTLPAKEIKELTDAFKALDVNGDGTLTYQEVVETMKTQKLEVPADLLEIMKDIDSDGSGQIDYTEFVAATLDKRMYISKENAWIAFRQFDLDGDGKISPEELQQVLGADGVGDHFDTAKVAEMIKEADTNGDGVISFEEFLEHMKA
jgi:calcium-dependent protein kinase